MQGEEAQTASMGGGEGVSSRAGAQTVVVRESGALPEALFLEAAQCCIDSLTHSHALTLPRGPVIASCPAADV